MSTNGIELFTGGEILDELVRRDGPDGAVREYNKLATHPVSSIEELAAASVGHRWHDHPMTALFFVLPGKRVLAGVLVSVGLTPAPAHADPDPSPSPGYVIQGPGGPTVGGLRSLPPICGIQPRACAGNLEPKHRDLGLPWNLNAVVRARIVDRSVPGSPRGRTVAMYDPSARSSIDVSRGIAGSSAKRRASVTASMEVQ